MVNCNKEVVMALAHAVGLVHQGDMVQLWHGKVAHENKDLISALNNLGKIVLLKSEYPLENFYFPELKTWHWANWTDRELAPIHPESLIHTPFKKLTWNGKLAGVIVNVAAINKVIVFSFNNTFLCKQSSPWGSEYGWHVKNYIDCIEGQIIERMLREHYGVQ